MAKGLLLKDQIPPGSEPWGCGSQQSQKLKAQPQMLFTKSAFVVMKLCKVLSNTKLLGQQPCQFLPRVLSPILGGASQV